MRIKLPSTKVFAVVAGLSLGIMVLLSVAGSIAEPRVQPGSTLYSQLSLVMKISFFSLFLVIAFAFTPLMVRLFFALLPAVFSQIPHKPAFIDSLIRNGDRFANLATVTLWAVYAAGLLITVPFLLLGRWGNT